MRTVTWEKGTHRLFDFDSSEIVGRKFKQGQSFRVFRDSVAINTTEAGNASTLGKLIASITFFQDNFWVYDALREELSKKKQLLLFVLKNYKGNSQPGIKLKQGDIIKMRRYLVKEVAKDGVKSKNLESCKGMNRESVNKTDSASNQEESQSEGQSKSSSRENEMSCGICLSSANNKENPIISLLCKCSGSVKFIHANCLQELKIVKEWLKSKVTQSKTDVSVVYNWKDFACDVCKTPFPGTYPTLISIDDIKRPDGSKIGVLRVEKPEGNYILFQRVRL